MHLRPLPPRGVPPPPSSAVTQSSLLGRSTEKGHLLVSLSTEMPLITTVRGTRWHAFCVARVASYRSAARRMENEISCCPARPRARMRPGQGLWRPGINSRVKGLINSRECVRAARPEALTPPPPPPGAILVDERTDILGTDRLILNCIRFFQVFEANSDTRAKSDKYT